MVVERRTPSTSDTRLFFWGQWLAGILALLGLLFALTLQKTDSWSTQYQILALVALLGSAPIFSLVGAYHRHHGYLAGLSRLLTGWLVLLASLTALGFITKTSEDFSREVLLVWSVSGFLALASLYLLLQYLSNRHWQALQAETRSLIIGTDAHAQELAGKLVQRKACMLGLVSTGSDHELAQTGAYPVLGNLAHLHQLILSQDIRRLYIALPLEQAKEVKSLYISLLDSNVDVIWTPDFSDITLLNHSLSDMDGTPLIHLNESPLTSYPTAALTKAILDRVLALLALIALTPLLIGTAMAVKLSSPGPILFKQKRTGWNGKVIEVWKFRSMHLHDTQEVRQASRNDPRITPVGQFIRRTSIDELPQFFNVLQGHMSLVGPRPHAIEHNDYYTDKINAYMARHRIKPGITGLAQISGYRGETDTLEKMQRRVELDLIYINQWSLWLDIKVLLKTPLSLFGKNAY